MKSNRKMIIIHSPYFPFPPLLQRVNLIELMIIVEFNTSRNYQLSSVYTKNKKNRISKIENRKVRNRQTKREQNRRQGGQVMEKENRYGEEGKGKRTYRRNSITISSNCETETTLRTVQKNKKKNKSNQNHQYQFSPNFLLLPPQRLKKNSKENKRRNIH